MKNSSTNNELVYISKIQQEQVAFMHGKVLKTLKNQCFSNCPHKSLRLS